MKTLVSIVGPTASGKTAAALALGSLWNTGIVSADSRQIFRHLDIGTAKPSADELKSLPHFLIDSLGPDQHISAGKYRELALQALDTLWMQHDIALLCGGSGLYLQAVWEGFDEMPYVPTEIRDALIAELNERGIVELAAELRRVDLLTAEKTDLKNPQRVIRALEVYRASGLPISHFRTGKKSNNPWRDIRLGIHPPKEILHARMDERVQAMFAQGLEQEARTLFARYGTSLNALQTVGYREFIPYLQGEISPDAVSEAIKRNTRAYAKRQMTFFKRYPEIHWFPSAEALVDAAPALLARSL